MKGLPLGEPLALPIKPWPSLPPDPFTAPLAPCPDVSVPPSSARSGCGLFRVAQGSRGQTTSHAVLHSPKRTKKKPEPRKALDFTSIFVIPSFNCGPGPSGVVIWKITLWQRDYLD